MGSFPPVDGGWHRVPPWRAGVEAVLAFTGHAVLAVDEALPGSELDGVDGYGGAHHPRVLLALAGSGWIDSLDALLVTRARPDVAPLVARPDLAGQPRVAFATSVRDDVQVFGRDDPHSLSVATVSRGIGGLPEISVELDERERGRGTGAAFVRAAAATVAQGRVVVAAVAPGNASSMRSFLNAGYSVIGSVQLLRPQRLNSPPSFS